MKKVNASDRLFATVTLCGRTIYNVAIEGITSIDQVLRIVSEKIRGMVSGAATLVLRNCSQGWAVKQLIRPAQVPEGIQLSLF